MDVVNYYLNGHGYCELLLGIVYLEKSVMLSVDHPWCERCCRQHL